MVSSEEMTAHPPRLLGDAHPGSPTMLTTHTGYHRGGRRSDGTTRLETGDD